MASDAVPAPDRRRRLLKIATGVAAAAAAGFLWIANLEIFRREDRIQLEEARMERAAAMVQLREAQEDLGCEPTFAWMKPNPQVREAARAVGVAFFQGKTLHVLARGLPRPPRTREYVLWAHFGAKRVRAGAYPVDDKGCLAGKHRIPEDLQHATGFAISLEPAGATDSPTGPIYLLPN